MEMQHDIGVYHCIKVLVENEENGELREVNTKRNWIKSIIHCQKVDRSGYGSWFPAVPPFQARDRDSRIVWILSGMIVCVKELWFLTDKINMHVSNGMVRC